jgi:SAM-dependent methyltransferase
MPPSPEMVTHYDETYYQQVYAGFENVDFARRWALGCALVAGYAGRQFDSVLEFGAGLGQNLEVINARQKWAVDISDVSRQACERKGIIWQNNLDAVPDHAFDMILSRHSLEHVPDPLTTLSKLLHKAKPGAVLFLAVPLDHSLALTSLEQFDEHKHLYSWSRETIKNLLLESGWRPQTISIHSGRLLRRMLFLLPRFPETFRNARLLMSTVNPTKSAEIMVRAESGSPETQPQ